MSFLKIIYLFHFLCFGFIATRGLFSSCGKQGLLSSHDAQAFLRGGSSCRRACALGT